MTETMTLEQFEKFAENLSDDDKRKVARTLGVALPVAPLDEQLAGVIVKKHTPKVSKRNPIPQETAYVAVPSLKLDANSGTRAFWVNARVARRVAEKMLELCDEEGL